MGKQIVEGKIDKIFTKDFGEADQYGNQYAVNININGQWYGLGKKKKPVANVKVGQNWHQLAEGDVIEAVCDVVERNGRTYYNVKSSDVTVKESAQGGSGNSGGSTGSSPAPTRAAGGNQMSNDDRQDAIMRQSAMGYAAQIVAGAMTSKSDLDQAAADVVRLANDYLLPYAKYGVTEDETRKVQEKEVQNQQAQQQASDDEEDFEYDTPF